MKRTHAILVLLVCLGAIVAAGTFRGRTHKTTQVAPLSVTRSAAKHDAAKKVAKSPPSEVASKKADARAASPTARRSSPDALAAQSRSLTGPNGYFRLPTAQEMRSFTGPDGEACYGRTGECVPLPKAPPPR